MKKSEEMMRLDRDLKNDPELAKKFKEAMREAAQTGTCKSEGELITRVAKSFGYGISMGELERTKAAKEELDPQELELAAGGEENCTCMWERSTDDEYGHGAWCVTAWHCEMVTLHTSTESKHAWCFYDYTCTDLFHARPRGA